MKKTFILLFLSCMLLACKKGNVDFSYSPAQPRAGQRVSFTNLTEKGKDWEWSFGDVTTSTSQNPSKIYKKPGTYLVTLKVDGKSYRQVSHEVTVYDTIPSISYILGTDTNASVLPIYKPVAFRAMIYNPYGHTLRYQWDVPEDKCVVVDKAADGADSVTGPILRMYLTRPNESYELPLHIWESKNSELVNEYDLSVTFTAKDSLAEAVLMQQADGMQYRQRVYMVNGGLVPDYLNTSLSPSDRHLLEPEQEMEVRYDGRLYSCGPEGLYVSMLNGEQKVCVTDEPVSAVMVTPVYARIWWATSNGIYYMPAVQSTTNAVDRTHIIRANEVENVVRLRYNYMLQ